jgi:predicted house-cleaning noncanonical NTP pyrophosphatase (MazG superfamily)
MILMRYDKLVRDNIPDIIRAKGEAVTSHVADAAEFRMKLREKLREEVEELLRDENAGEFADVLEVLDAYAAELGISAAEIAAVKSKKASERGGFAKRIILETA